MKKINRKGFTLVELLAVIVILAIVVGITLVTVLPTLKDSRQEAFELTAQTAADYLEKQYQLSLIGTIGGARIDFSEDIIDPETGGANMKKEDFTAAGLKADNYIYGSEGSYWYINPRTGRACVQLTAKTNKNNGGNGGEYYDVDPDYIESTGCQ